MNKAEFIKKIANEQNITLKEAEKTVNIVIDTIAKGISEGDKISIRDFGVWDTYDSKETRRMIPGTQDIVDIPSQKRIRFKAGSKLQDSVNDEDED